MSRPPACTITVTVKRTAVVVAALIMLTSAEGFARSDRSYLTFGLGKTYITKPEVTKRNFKSVYNASLGAGFDFTTWLSGHIVGEYHLGSSRTSSRDWQEKVKSALIWLKLSPYRFASHVDPYVFLGVGYVYGDRDLSAEATTYGAGVDVWPKSRIGVFLEGRNVKAYFEHVDLEAKVLKIGVIYLLRE